MTREDGYDVAVIGAGIAGASVAAELAGEASVVLLEMERQPGYHTTGRSAAVYAPSYGPAPIRALTRAARRFFEAPPEGFCEHPLLDPIETVFLARADQREAVEAMLAEMPEAGLRRIDAGWLAAQVPILRADYAAEGLLDRSTSTIDVAALHQGYLRQLGARGGALRTRAEVTGLSRDGAGWRVATTDGPLRAGIVINAAGAWADRVGALAGAEPVGLKPLRRTALIVEGPEGADLAALPMVVDIDEEFYLKPDAGKLLISPANEDPDAPSDVQPDEMDVAICVDRIERAFNISVRRIENWWAGLRSFVADKCPVVGFSTRAEGFFWLAGQGGYGIQSAPALAQLAAATVLGREMPEEIAAEGLDLRALAPDRAALRG